MTHTDRPAPHSTIADENRARRAVPSSARRSRIQLISDAVVASYIHDISDRDRNPRQISNRRSGGADLD